VLIQTTKYDVGIENFVFPKYSYRSDILSLTQKEAGFNVKTNILNATNAAQIFKKTAV